MAERRPQSLSQLLQESLHQWKLTPAFQRHELFENWLQIAGPQIADRARPLKIQGNQLLLQVDHPAWAQELQFLKVQLLEKIQQHYPSAQIRGLRFVLK